MVAAGFRSGALAFAVVGCTSIAADQHTFEDTRWRITAINAVATPSHNWVYWVRFSGGYMRGNICNRFEAPYTVARDILQLNGFTSTERGCSNPESGFEESAFTILHKPMRINWRSGRRLILGNRWGSIELELER